jgi:uroporphyrin-3 C-methyltransferase
MSENSLLPLPPPARLPKPFWRQPGFWVTLVILGLIVWQWRETGNRLESVRQDMARRLVEREKTAKESQILLNKAVEQTAELQRKYGALEARIEEFQSQAEALRSLYQEAAISRDDAMLAEVEQNINIAVQQLQLAGNLQAAILALSAADERLARLERPRFLPLRRTLARDLEQLRMTPFVDTPGMNLRLENVILSADRWPLLLAFKPPPPAIPETETPPETRPWWSRLLHESWREIRDMVRIRRFDRHDPVLLAPEQELILRENIKLRLLNARLALLSNDQWTFRNELTAAHGWLKQYFDTEEESVQKALTTLEQLSATEITVEYPGLNDSLNALQTLKASRERR